MKYRNDAIIALQAILRKSENENKQFDSGICGLMISHIKRAVGVDLYWDNDFDRQQLIEVLYAGFKSWPKFSGNQQFPIPATLKNVDVGGEMLPSLAAERDYWCREGKHLLWSGPAGRLRRELLRHLIVHFEQYDVG